jgi:hypothetical protein
MQPASDQNALYRSGSYITRLFALIVAEFFRDMRFSPVYIFDDTHLGDTLLIILPHAEARGYHIVGLRTYYFLKAISLYSAVERNFLI